MRAINKETKVAEFSNMDYMGRAIIGFVRGIRTMSVPIDIGQIVSTPDGYGIIAGHSYNNIENQPGSYPSCPSGYVIVFNGGEVLEYSCEEIDGGLSGEDESD